MNSTPQTMDFPTETTFTLIINCDNAAFGETNQERNQEVVRILRVVADRLEEAHGLAQTILRDYNGNKVGEAGFEGYRP